jgi:hypothetical protein
MLKNLNAIYIYIYIYMLYALGLRVILMCDGSYTVKIIRTVSVALVHMTFGHTTNPSSFENFNLRRTFR